MTLFKPATALILCGLANTALADDPAKNSTIDLQCQQQAQQLVERLVAEQLLIQGSDLQAQDIVVEFCTRTEQSAQAQHEAGKKRAIENWFFESTGGKPGNERLKRLKR